MEEYGYYIVASGMKESSDRCKHTLVGVTPIVAVRVEGVHESRCLLCGAVGPVAGNVEDSRRMLLDGRVASIHRIS
jgi:hypothetical protein